MSTVTIETFDSVLSPEEMNATDVVILNEKRFYAVTPEHLAALRSAIGQWGYGAGDYDGFPNASVPATLAELLAILEGGES